MTAAAHAALDVLERPGAAGARAARWASAWPPRWPSCPASSSVRGRGLMLACELDPSRPDGAPEVVRRALLEQRLVAQRDRPDDRPAAAPAVISEADADAALDRLRAALDA